MEHPFLMDMAIHHFDMMRYLLGRNAVRVTAQTWNPKVSNTEGDGLFERPHLLSFVVTRHGDTSGSASVDYTTGNKTAVGAATSCFGSADFINRSGTLQYAAGETSKTVAVQVCGDTFPEANETMVLKLSNPVGASITDNLGVGTIVNDD